MKYCSVFGCYSNDKFGSKRNFFPFPSSCIERAFTWDKFCQDPSEGPLHRRFICDLHFTDLDFTASNRLHLKANAIPSLNGPKKKHISLGKDFSDSERQENTQDNCSFDHMSDSSNSLDDKLSNESHCNDEHSYSSNEIHPSQEQNQVIKIPSWSEDILGRNLEVLNLPSNSVKYQKLDLNLKHSLIESVLEGSLCKKSKASQDLGKIPCKTYKTTQEDIEVKLYVDYLEDKDQRKEIGINDVGGAANISRSSRKLNICDENNLLKGFQINLVSTVSFEHDDESSISASAEEQNVTPIPENVLESSLLQTKDDISTSSSIKITGVYSKVGHVFKYPYESIHRSTPSSLFLRSKQSKPTITITRPKSNPLQKRLAELNEIRKKNLLKKYRNKVFSKKPFALPLDRNNPKYSIAATAESLGTFDSYVEVPLENVDLDAGEWHKLFTPSEITFPRLPESQIGPMVNKLRSRLPTLNDRDRLEVSFLLSLMSAYPNAPKHIKEILFQRLNLVYIATMFKWDTALALGTKVGTHSTPNVSLQGGNSIRINKTSRDTFSVDDSSCIETKTFKTTKKRSQFAFEVIVQEKAPSTKEGSKASNIKTL